MSEGPYWQTQKVERLSVAIISRSPASYGARRLADEIAELGAKTSWLFPELLLDQAGSQLTASPHLVINRLLGDEQALPQVLAWCSQFEVSLPAKSVVINKTAAVEQALSKSSQAKIFLSQRLPQPTTATIDGSSSVRELVAELGLPLVIKPDRGYGGEGIRLCRSRLEIRAALGALAGRDPVAQAFIAEAETTLRLLMVGGELLLAYERRAKAGDWRANVSQGASIGPCSVTAAEVNLAQRALTALGLDIGGVDLVRTGSGPLLLEVNPSPGLAGIEAVSGDNVTRKMAEAFIAAVGGD